MWDSADRTRQDTAGRFLAEASHTLASSLDYDTTLSTVAKLAIPVMADCCVIYLHENDGSIRRVAMSHEDPEAQEAMYEVIERFPVNIDAPSGTAKVLRTGESELIPQVPDSLLVEVARDAKHLAFLRRFPPRSLMSVPLATRGRSLGAITFMWDRPDRHYTPTDLRLAEDLARHAALAVDNARLYSEARAARAAAEQSLAAQRASEIESRRLEDQLRHSQKMEAIGRLAGGVAHDFNNILTTIQGYGEFLLGALAADTASYRHAQAIHHAATRASTVTERLLAFGRKQVFKLESLSLNAVVQSMGVMLEHLLGDDIRLQIDLEEDLRHTRGDLGQLEQIVLNLALNARDAMPTGGTIAIRTRNKDVSELDAQRGVGIEPGRYISILVSDTGEGMDASTRSRVFEPFFTTKAPGKGTGLGLSTVYGTVRQSGGRIELESQPGAGTTFEIVLPGVDAPPSARSEARIPSSPTPGSETILLVEDDEDVRALMSEVLEGSGYTVVAAKTGPDAIETVEHRAANVDMLVTDIVMPDMNGCEVAQRLLARHPELRVLYVSGHPGDFLTRYGVSSESVLRKPFTVDVLRRRVRATLDNATA